MGEIEDGRDREGGNWKYVYIKMCVVYLNRSVMGHESEVEDESF